MNSAVLAGFVSQPEVRYTNEGKAIGQFQLSFPNANANQDDLLKSIKCIAFSKSVVEVISTLQENQPVILTGAINITNQQNSKTQIIEFKISSIELVPVLTGINSIALAGRTGKDPDVKYFESGAIKTVTSLAVRRTSTDTDWFNLEFWGKTAEVAGNYVSKGGLIGVNGFIKFDEWSDRETGEARSRLVVVANQLELLSKKQDSQDIDVF